jgi:hypothetical protein
MINPWRKLFVFSIGGTLGIAALAYVLNLVADNKILQADVETALAANQSQQTAMRMMAEEMARQNQAVVERDKRVRVAQSKLKQTQRRLRDAENNPKITVVERECMDSHIPGPVLDVMREAPHRNGTSPTGTDMPSGYFLRRNGGATVRGPKLGGPGGLRQRTANAHPHTQPGPRRDPGVLPR